jgi:hypothetical protein
LNEEIYEGLEKELGFLEAEFKMLNGWNNDLRENLKRTNKDELFQHFGYFTESDLLELTKQDDENLIAIQAPKGTVIDTPEPQNVERLYKETLKVRKDA